MIKPFSMPNTGKYNHLLTNIDLRRWHDNLVSGSPITAEVYLRTLGLYCDLEKTTPDQIVEQAGSKEFSDGFTDFVRRLEGQGKAGSYILRFRKVVTNWASYNDKELKLKVKIKGVNESPTLSGERVPTRDELSKILRMAVPRGRVSIAMMSFAGLRPESLGDFKGTDGIVLGDFPELKIFSARVEFGRPPCIVVVRNNLSKARHRYFSMIGSEGIIYIQDYLRRRVEAGEELSTRTPLLGFDPRGVRKNVFLRTALVTRDIREAIVKAGFAWRPYVLRSFCDTGLALAESKGWVSHAYLQFWMGHKGDIEARYSVNKGVLPQEMVRDMKDSYRKSLRFLQTTATGQSEDEQQSDFKKLVATAVGYRNDEIAKMDFGIMSDTELQGLVKQRLGATMKNNGAKQRVIPALDVERYILQGWEYVSVYPNDKRKAIVKLPL